ncbi:MAG TPA: xanthine dehydrogenase family protein molybdopterin-binding subunit [Dehalococcoidia bacterium]|nr:xanthine dehydrogenase family protein molybdopterin-binding subunit [Dehalococcoidia bacterium]
MSELSVVGKALARVDGVRKATAQFTYGTDFKLPGMLYGKVLRSPYPHARILSIDTSQAEALPGVKAVVTGKDSPEALYGSRINDLPPLARDKVRYIGEPVAAVAAVDERTAAKALGLVQVEYQELPAVFDPRAAMQPGAPIVHENLGSYQRNAAQCYPVPGTNILNHMKVRHGDVEAGFAQADFIFEDSFTTQAQQHCCIEPHAAVCQVGLEGKATVWTSTQNPYKVRSETAAALGIPASRARVIATQAGGGFGGKSRARVEAHGVLLARKSGRPVKIVMTRHEVFTATTTRHPSHIRIKTGVKADGTLVAREVEVILDGGAYGEAGEIVSWEVGQGAAGPYRIPHVKVDAYEIYTNKVPAGAMRGFGWPQIMWASESQMDVIAQKLGLDPLEIRLRNAVEEGSISATGEVLHSVGLVECLRKAAEAIGWDEDRPPYRGRGIACVTKISVPFLGSSAFVKINEDGRIGLLTSATDIGQGSDTVLAQICAEEMGVGLSDVEVAVPDTDTTPPDMGVIASRITFHVGNAIRLAAADARSQVLALAADMLEASAEDLEIAEGKVFVRGSPERALALAQVATAAYYQKGGPILGRGSFLDEDLVPTDRETGQSPKPSPYIKYGATAVEVEVDPETGMVKVTKMASAHDCGRAINPLLLNGQIEGGAATGLGFALWEEMVFDGGRITNPSFMDYRIPSTVEVPAIHPIIVEAPHKAGPFGAKGAGEASTIGVAGAVGNAIYDAVQVRIVDLPLTWERVLAAIEARAAQEPKEA